MTVDIASLVDTSALVDSEAIDAADVLTPINNLVEALEDVLEGSIAVDHLNYSAATELTIVSGVITVTQQMHTIDTQSDAASDDLDTITMTEGDVCWFWAAHTDRTVVLKDGTGNIKTFDGNDVSLDNTEKHVRAIRKGSTVYIESAYEGIFAVGTPATTADFPSTDPTTIDGAINNIAARLMGPGMIIGLEVDVAGDEDIDVKEGQCLDDTFLQVLRLTADAQIDMTTTGINALDTGAIGADTWYYVWIVEGSSGTGLLASLSATAPTLPGGYDTYKRRIGAVRTNGTSDLRKQVTIPGSGAKREVRYREVTNAAPFRLLDTADIGNGSGAATAIDASPLVPTTSRWMIGNLGIASPSNTVDVYWYVNSVSNFLFQLGATHVFYTQWTFELNSSQAAAVYGDADDEDIYLYVLGYYDDLTDVSF